MTIWRVALNPVTWGLVIYAVLSVGFWVMLRINSAYWPDDVDLVQTLM